MRTYFKYSLVKNLIEIEFNQISTWTLTILYLLEKTCYYKTFSPGHTYFTYYLIVITCIRNAFIGTIFFNKSIKEVFYNYWGLDENKWHLFEDIWLNISQCNWCFNWPYYRAWYLMPCLRSKISYLAHNFWGVWIIILYHQKWTCVTQYTTKEANYHNLSKISSTHKVCHKKSSDHIYYRENRFFHTCKLPENFMGHHKESGRENTSPHTKGTNRGYQQQKDPSINIMFHDWKIYTIHIMEGSQAWIQVKINTTRRSIRKGIEGWPHGETMKFIW